MQFITETLADTHVLTELDKSTGNKQMFLEGIFMQDTIKNRNGRVYPKAVMAEAVNKYIETYVTPKRSMGELNHPPTPQVNPERASHIITSLREDGNNWMGKAKVLNTPMGNLVRNLIDDGVQMGVSSRGLGAVKESNGANVVQSGYFITAVDTVSDPSAPEAFVNGIMENKEWIFENGILVEREIEDVKHKVNKAVATGNFDEDFLTDMFKNILTNI